VRRRLSRAAAGGDTRILSPDKRPPVPPGWWRGGEPARGHGSGSPV